LSNGFYPPWSPFTSLWLAGAAEGGEPLAGLPAANSLNIDHLPLLISSLMQPDQFTPVFNVE